MNKITGKRNIDTVFVLIVFSIFAFSVLMVLMLGAGVYRNINDVSRESEQEHTALSYIWTKVKNFDTTGAVHVGDFHDSPALFIDEKIGETYYRTSIYFHNGWLMELYSEATLVFSPSDGDRIVQVESLSFQSVENSVISSLGNELIEVSVNDRTLLLSPRSERGGLN